MMIAAVIENNSESEILLSKKTNSDGPISWTLPCYGLADDITSSIAGLIQKCHDEYNVGISIEASSVFFENGEIVVFYASLFSHTFLSNSAEKSYQWFATKELSSLNLDENYASVFLSLLENYNCLDSVKKIAIDIINDISIEFCAFFRADIQEQKDAINVFIMYPEKIFCPFGFRLDFAIDETKQMQFITSIFTVRTPDPGDKTDIYVLFSNCMAIIQKLYMRENIYIDYMSLFSDIEVNSASLVFLNQLKSIEQGDHAFIKSSVQDSFIEFTMSLSIFGNLIGSFITELDENRYSQKYLNYLCSSDMMYNCQARKEVQYYSDFKKRISLFCIENAEYQHDFFGGITWEVISGVDGKILCQIKTEEGYLLLNYISNECWSRVCQVISDMQITEYSLLCQSNMLYMFEGNNIWMFEGDFDEYWVEEEKRKLIDRQNKERLILRLNRQFKWKYPINFSRFEELMAELYEKEELVQRVRLIGKSRSPDGGRDLMIWKTVRTGHQSFGGKLIVGQCKAYNRSVNKADVTDIRDTIEHYDAVGFHLFVSSSLTVPLIDSLIKLKEKYESDWWAEREIFKRLRQRSDIADRYTDILDIVEEYNFRTKDSEVTA